MLLCFLFKGFLTALSFRIVYGLVAWSFYFFDQTCSNRKQILSSVGTRKKYSGQEANGAKQVRANDPSTLRPNQLHPDLKACWAGYGKAG